MIDVRVKEKHDEYKARTKYLAERLKGYGIDFECPKGLVQRPDGENGQRHLLRLANFVPLARYLTSHRSFSVAESVMFAAKRNVKLRQECNDYFKMAKLGSRDSFERHEAAIHVFQEVRDILRQRLKADRDLHPKLEATKVLPDAKRKAARLDYTVLPVEYLENDTDEVLGSASVYRRTRPTINETRVAGRLIGLITVAMKFLTFSGGLKWITKRYWFRQNAGVNNDEIV
ncbi:hypothetical protein J7T55_015745 [Diaporthe amygdali]|uniref:uncharacterized protein n=1 Tax=Phomopsis amygdali TaxID=1214568 RepID=UPI0022FE03BB|nr:uncharacterized protein J7T55_015745 [Diaporthe amygdali]KAJ0107280.1 hypothetical protein J7T55_015745 [Diaporthe amygdali]